MMTSTKTVKTFLLSMIFGTALLLALLFLNGIQSARAAQSWLPETSGSIIQQDITLATTDTNTSTFGITYEPKNPKVGEEVTFTITRSSQTEATTTVFHVDFGDGYFGGKPVAVTMSSNETKTEVKHTYQYPSIHSKGGATKYTYKVEAKYTPDSGTTWNSKSVEVAVRPVLTLTHQPATPKVGEVVSYCAKINPGYRKQDLSSNVYSYDLYTMSFGDSGSKQAINNISHFREVAGKWDTTCFTHTYATSGTYTAKVVYTTGVYGQNAAEASVTISVAPDIPSDLMRLPEGQNELTFSNGDKLTGIASLLSQGVAYVKVLEIDFAHLPAGSGVTSATFFAAFTITFHNAQGEAMTVVNLTGVNYVMNIASTKKPHLWRSTLRSMYYLGTIWQTLWNNIFARLTTTSLTEEAAGSLTIPLQTGASTYVVRGSSTLSLYLPVITR